MENITLFTDSIGRMVIGDVNVNKTLVKVKNPAVVNVQADQNTGQISVQLLPYVFSEFVKNTDEVEWTFQKSNIIFSDNLELDDRIISQYKQIMSNAPAAPATDAETMEEPEVIKLFDE